MCLAIEEMREEAAKEAKWQEKVDTVHRLLAKGLSIEDIAEGVDLTKEKVKEIASQPA